MIKMAKKDGMGIETVGWFALGIIICMFCAIGTIYVINMIKGG